MLQKLPGLNALASLVPLMLALACANTPTASPASETQPHPAAESTPEGVPPVDEELEAALEQASAGVEDPGLAKLLRAHWLDTLEHAPTWATQLGVHRWDDKLGDPSLAAEVESRVRRDAFLAQANALDASAFSAADRLSLQIFIEEMETSQRTDVCAFSTWSVSARGNPLGSFNRLARSHLIRNEGDAANFLARAQQYAARFEASEAKLRVGLDAGRTANAEATRRVIEMVDRQLAAETPTWAVMEVEFPAEYAAESKQAFMTQLSSVVDQQIRPAAKRYADFLRGEVMPKARSDAKAGLVALPQGEDCYNALIWQYTTLPMSAQEIHELGLAEMARVNAEMTQLGKKLFKERNLAKTLKRLRTDPKLHFSTSQEVESFARAALADAKAAMPKSFGRLPKADCVVTPIPDYEAPFTTIAYYNQPHADGSKPGEYFVNTHAPETRPRYEARVLAYHESIPGHHLQIAISQELDAVPAFRRYGGQTVFVEGWGLYSERLSDEMGLYPDDLDRMGVLSFDAWRAGRLVVDTGIHAMGWSRQQAVDYLIAHTALAENNIDNEVDRYITTPGQALAYKIGQREFLALRDQAKAALGEGFRLAEFHDVVLSAGALSIPRLRERVQAWLNNAK